MIGAGIFAILGRDYNTLEGTSERKILYRSVEPVLIQELVDERNEIVPNVVFTIGIDRRDDLGLPDRFDVYYGLADKRIGMARLDLQDILPNGGIADSPKEKIYPA